MLDRKLIAIPIPFEDESAGSVLLRASSANGLYKPSNLISRFYPKMDGRSRPGNTRSLLSNEYYFQIMCETLSINTQQVRSLKPLRVSETFGADFIFNGIRLHRTTMRVDEPAVCPLCIEENGYMYRKWDHKFIRSCTKHNVRLLDTCPQCSTAISWDRRELNQCDCQHKFIDTSLEKPESFVLSSTKVIEDILLNSKKEEYDILIDLLMTLKSYYRCDSIFDDNLLYLASLGLTEPETLETNIYIEIMADKDFSHYHPRVTMSDFLLASSTHVKQIGENIAYRLLNAEGTIRVAANEKDYLSINVVEKSFGMERKDVLQLIREKILIGYKEKPASPWLVSKKSINELIFKLDSLSRYNVRQPLISLSDLSHSSQSIGILIIHVLNGLLTPVDFNSRDLLSDIKVILPPPTKEPTVKLFNLITPQALSDFTGAPLNTIRTSFQKNGKLRYFSEGKTAGSQKYITPDDAMKLAKSYVHTIRNRKRRAKYTRQIQTGLPVSTHVNVVYM